MSELRLKNDTSTNNDVSGENCGFRCRVLIILTITAKVASKQGGNPANINML